MEKIIKVIDAFTGALGKALSCLILPLIAVVLYTAVMRYFLKVSVPWGFEGALFLFGSYCIVGGAFTHLHKGHVNVDALTARLPAKWQARLEIVSQLIIIAVMACIIYMGYRWAYKSTLILERSIHGTEWNPQIWWFKWLVPISAALFALQCVSEILKNVLKLRQLGRG